MKLATPLAAALVLLSMPVLAHVHVPGLDVNGQCVGDADGDSAVAINELIQAVNNALDGCADLPVEIQFKAMVGDEPFACGSAYSGIGTGNSQIVPSDFRVFISNVRLIARTGAEVPISLEQDGIWQYQNVAVLDFEDGTGPCFNGNTATNTVVKGTVPSGVYTGVAFDLGLPFDLNHGNAATAPSPLNFTAMFWSWQSGYKAVRVDTADDKFRIHLGSTGCTGAGPSQPPTSCAAPNVGAVRIDGFNPTHSIIAADLKTLLATSNIDVNEAETPPGCMSNPDDAECEPLLPRFGLTFPGGQPDAEAQQFFHILHEHDDGGAHLEIVVASSADGSGALIAHPEFETSEAIPLTFDECLGSEAEDCAGGTALYSAVNPGISPLEESEPDESLYKLTDATTVTLEVTALAEGLTITFNNTTLDSVGDTVVLGVTPEFHADLQTQLAIAGGGEPSGTYAASFKLTTTDNGYSQSEALTLTFTPQHEGGHD
jgi:uncharacterized repeat protein (TIGR04052 family)